jgi:hypothetical protein
MNLNFRSTFPTCSFPSFCCRDRSGWHLAFDLRLRWATIPQWASTAGRWKLSGRQRHAAAAAKRATDAQVLADAETLIAAWNERQAKRMPMLFAPTIGAAIAARYWFL